MLMRLENRIEADGLRWRRSPGFALAVDSFSAPEGSRTALIGGNGSGKSSLIELLAGLHRPDGGTVRLSGLDPAAAAARCQLGVQTPLATHNQVLRVRDMTGLHASVYGRVDPRVAAALEVGEFARQTIASLSQGQRRRLDLHLALAHTPRLALLDEPTAGLDASRAAAFLDLCAALAADGTAIVTATHDAAELGAADHALHLAAGSVAASGSPEQLLREAVGTQRAELRFADAGLAEAVAKAASAPRIRRSGATVQLSGYDGLRAEIDRLVAVFNPDAWSVGKAGPADLLDHVSERSAR